MSGDLRCLRDVWRDEKAGELLPLVSQRIVNAIAAGGDAEVQRLEVRFVLDALRLEGGEKAVLAGVEGWVAERPGVSALAAVVVVVELDDVLEGANFGVGELGEVCFDVVVEVDFDVRVLRLVGEPAGGAPVPVPPVGADEGFVVGDLRLVDDCRAGGFDESDEFEEDSLLLRVGVHPEAVPGDAEGGVLEGLFGG